MNRPTGRFFICSERMVCLMQQLTDKQKRFCQEYLIDANALQAAIRAGYSKKTAVDASRWLNDDANKPNSKYKPQIAECVREEMEKLQSKRIASAEEVVQYLTSVLRSETTAEVIVVEGVGEGCSSARRMLKAPDERERLKAAELLGKRYGIFSEKLNVESAIPVVITGADMLED